MSMTLPGCADLRQQVRDAALQLAALLGARDEQTQVQLHHALAPEERRQRRAIRELACTCLRLYHAHVMLSKLAHAHQEAS